MRAIQRFLLNNTTEKLSTKQWLLFALICSAVFGPGISYSKLYLFHIMLIINLTYLIFSNFKQTTTSIKELFSLKHKMNYFFLFSIILFACWVPFVGSKSHAIKHLIFISLGFSLTLIIIEQTKKIKDLIFLFRTFAFIYCIDIIIALLEALQLIRWPISRLSFNNDLFGRTNEINDILSKTKYHDYVLSMPTTFHWNPNNFATFALLGLPFLLLHRNFLISSIGITTIVTLIVAAGSKSAFLSVIVILILSLFFIKKRLKNILVLLFVTLFFSTSGFHQLHYKSLKLYEIQSFVYNSIGIKPPQREALSTITSNPNEGSSNDRIELIKKGFELFKENPFLGVGGGNSKYIMEQEEGIGINKLTNLHNFWLELLVEGGGLYFAIFIVWCLTLILYFFKATIKKKFSYPLNYFNSTILLAMFGLIISGIGPSSMIFYLPLYLFLGLALSVYHVSKNNESTSSIRY